MHVASEDGAMEDHTNATDEQVSGCKAACEYQDEYVVHLNSAAAIMNALHRQRMNRVLL